MKRRLVSKKPIVVLSSSQPSLPELSSLKKCTCTFCKTQLFLDKGSKYCISCGSDVFVTDDVSHNINSGKVNPANVSAVQCENCQNYNIVGDSVLSHFNGDFANEYHCSACGESLCLSSKAKTSDDEEEEDDDLSDEEKEALLADEQAKSERRKAARKAKKAKAETSASKSDEEEEDEEDDDDLSDEEKEALLAEESAKSERRKAARKAKKAETSASKDDEEEEEEDDDLSDEEKEALLADEQAKSERRKAARKAKKAETSASKDDDDDDEEEDDDLSDEEKEALLADEQAKSERRKASRKISQKKKKLELSFAIGEGLISSIPKFEDKVPLAAIVPFNVVVCSRISDDEIIVARTESDTVIATLRDSETTPNRHRFMSPQFLRNLNLAVSSAKDKLEALSNMGFKVVEVPLKEGSKGMLDKHVLALSSTVSGEATKRIMEYRDNLEQSLVLASVALNLNAIAGATHPLKAHLYDHLSNSGLRHPELVIDEAFSKSSDEFCKLLLSSAFDLMDKTPEERAALSSVLEAQGYRKVTPDSSHEDAFEQRLTQPFNVETSSAFKKSPKVTENSSVMSSVTGYKATHGRSIFEV